MISFIEAQFGDCTLVWMFHGTVLNRKINHLHERSLRIVYKDSIISFHELLQKDHYLTTHHRNIQSLAIKLYKIKENLSDEIMISIFSLRLIKYNLRTQSDFSRNSVNSSKCGLNSVIIIIGSKAKFHFHKLHKSQKKGKAQTLVKVYSFNGNQKLCVVKNLNKYLELTEKRRDRKAELLLRFKNPFKKIVSSTAFG